MTIKAVIFDFDGVLADSEPLHLRAYQDVLTPRGVMLSRDDYYAKYLGFDDEGVFRQLSEDRGWPIGEREVAALIDEKGRAFDRLVRNTDVLYPGAVQCVERMAAAFPLGIASGALEHEIRGILQRGGVERHFRFVVASGHTPASKPAPDPYRLAATLHRLDPAACVAIEDSQQGVESAKSAGLACIALTHTYPAGALGGADRIVSALDDITPDLVRSI